MSSHFLKFASVVLILSLAIGWSLTFVKEEPVPLLDLGVHVSEGAAAGYVADDVCARCHADLYESYQSVGMAQSFKSPANAKSMEMFGQAFYYEPLQRYYVIEKRDDELTFRRYQIDKHDDEINEIEIPISWVMGSGNRARSYLYQTEWGELFMLPISWYTEGSKWEMSPGFENPDHPGIHRQIPLNCMFCHNAYPEVPTGSDVHWSLETFPHDLPEGTGCQRCHGPGANHVRTVLSGSDIDNVRAAITNPSKLSPELRDSVCFQCHMLPSASLAGARRFGRGVYSFRPGESFSDYMVHVDVAEQGVNSTDRFEINHHGYRFFQSSCYRESEGELSCISCHDPHVKPESSAFRKDVAGVCTNCHENSAKDHEREPSFAEEDCVTCHMPRRRTGDVIHVTMTDHLISRGPFDLPSLVDTTTKKNRVITAVDVLEFGNPPKGSEGDIYRSIAALRSGRNIDAARRSLERALEHVGKFDNDPYVDLATAQFNAGKYSDAEASARKQIEDGNSLRAAYTVLGNSLLAQGQSEQATQMLLMSIDLQPHPETHFNLAAIYIGQGQYDEAEQQLDAAIALRPFMSEAWKYKARLLAARNEPILARDALIRVLQLQPLDLPIYGELIDLLREIGEPAEADRYLELGMRMSRVLSEL